LTVYKDSMFTQKCMLLVMLVELTGVGRQLITVGFVTLYLYTK